MGGIIEDKIFELCDFEKLSVREVLEELNPQYARSYSVLSRHMRKMVLVGQLEREKINGIYVYWNPKTLGK